MSASCHSTLCDAAPAADPRYRRILWTALAINAAMFVIELGAGIRADSLALFADSIDFLGDAANFGLSLAVLAMLPVWRSRAALVKGATMLAFGVFVLAQAAWNAYSGSAPEPIVMGWVGALALIANVSVAVMLFAYRGGDANMRSVWLCSRNDAIGNVAVMIAALGVFGTGAAWPDLAVAVVMAALAIAGGASVIGQARGELRAAPHGDRVVQH
jgi:Co/Zn/Cd efflux system component